MSLRYEHITGLMEIESDLGNPTFYWNGGTYNFVPSISEFQRELQMGGYNYIKLLTATIRKYELDVDNNFVTLFPSGYPSSQDIITYSLDGTQFRIESVKHDPTNSYMRIIAHSISKTK